MSEKDRRKNEASSDEPEPRVAVVLSGAVARGAFQAGALGEVLARLGDTVPAPSIFIGTSAGAINAVLWAKESGKCAGGHDARLVAERVLGVWRSMPAKEIYEAPLSWSPRVMWHSLRRLEWPALRGLLCGGAGMGSLLDTTRLQHKADEILHEPLTLPPSIDRVGVVATWLPSPTTTGSASGRSVLFLQEKGPPSEWLGSPERALDVQRCALSKEHVLASCADPVAFPAESVPGAANGWYVDGGVRLNTPLLPAIMLGATHVIVISAMSVGYAPWTSNTARPQLIDTSSQVMHALLADRTVEDLLAVQKMNRLVAQARHPLKRSHGGPRYRPIRVAVVAPAPGSLRELAKRSWTAKDVRWPELLQLKDNAVLGRLLRSAGDDASFYELLSYLYFDRDYMDASYEAGVCAANGLFAEPAENGQTAPWHMKEILTKLH